MSTRIARVPPVQASLQSRAGPRFWPRGDNQSRCAPPPDRFVFGDFSQGEAEFLGKMCARDLNETQISDIRDDASAIGIEKHHLHLCADSRRSHSVISDLKFLGH